ncbi:MAG: carboxypeptidase regulatory-like domain-containing protein [Candidatus Riflebacteria bacterium]|nr:carboxypeptidase regulatory-like domain-containing protein [Candidatus Riflebacteria bacterium]
MHIYGLNIKKALTHQCSIEDRRKSFFENIYLPRFRAQSVIAVLIAAFSFLMTDKSLFAESYGFRQPHYSVISDDMLGISSESASVKSVLVSEIAAVFVDGPVYVNHQRETFWTRLPESNSLLNGDAIKTENFGWAVFSINNRGLILVRPYSELIFSCTEGVDKKFTVLMKSGSILVSCEENNNITVAGENLNFCLKYGDASYESDGKSHTLCALKSEVYYRLPGSKSSKTLRESYSFQIGKDGIEKNHFQFNTSIEYEKFRRLNAYLKRDIKYQTDTFLINGKFVSSMETDSEGFRIIDSGDGPVPKMLNLRIKITPYPLPQDNFELYINKKLIYLLKETGNGFYHANIVLPAFPEFELKIHHVNFEGKKEQIYSCSFTFLGKQRKKTSIRDFFNSLSDAFSRRDSIFIRNSISREYRDGFGNSYFEFIRHIENSLREHRDIRVTFHPHTFEFKDSLAKVKMNYRLTALGENWDWRYEDKGSDIISLIYSDGKWLIKAKEKGMFFQRIKVTLDLRLGILKGRVTDESSNRAVSGVKIRILNTSLQTTSDSMGDYVFYHLPPGKYDLEIFKNGYGKIVVSNVEVKSTGRNLR